MENVLIVFGTFVTLLSAPRIISAVVRTDTTARFGVLLMFATGVTCVVSGLLMMGG